MNRKNPKILVDNQEGATRPFSCHSIASFQTNAFYLLELGVYDKKMMRELREQHNNDFFELTHHDSVDEVGKRALASMRKVHPELFEARHMQECFSRGFNANIRTVRPVTEIEGFWNGFLRSSRPNGFDKPTWDNWEVDEDMLKS